MADRRAVLLGTALVTLIMVLSSMGLLAAYGGAAAVHATGTSVSARTTPVASVATPSQPLGANPALAGDLNVPSMTNAVNPVAAEALAQAHAAGVPATDVFVPRAGATPTQAAQAAAQGHVTPLYTRYSPAPIGLADYGLSADPNGNGSIVASVLNTSSVFASFDPNSTGVQPTYPFSSSPDAYGVQLNAVTTGVNLFGNSNYEFWTQNVFEYYAQLHSVYLVTNVWNFTGPSLSANAIYAHGPLGQQVGTTFYYAEKVLSGLVYPFDLNLWMNNSLNASRNQVTFTVGLTDPGNPSIDGNYAYDWVVFNSTGPGTPSNYTADGTAYNPFGLTNDFEVILGGPGGGSTADLFQADANLTLSYWNSTMSSYVSVPSAYSYGGETGETVTGGYVGWMNNTTTGAPYGVLTTGPGMLLGLWNATGAAGLDKLTLAITPSNAFYFLSPNWASNFSYQGDPYWAPQELTNGVFWLAPGSYSLGVSLSEYDEFNTSFVLTGAGYTVTQALTANSANGIYTPLYFWSNSQFSALSTSGTGTPTDPYQIVNTQTYNFNKTFGLFNDYTFPIFTGVFLWGTTASVVLAGMPALTTNMPYVNFPSTNDLGYLFYGASNVALVNSTQISGWFTTNVVFGVGSGFDANYYTTANVVEWNSTNLLIDNNTFLTQASGLYMALGTNNTVFGNTFEMVANPVFAACAAFGVCPLNLSLGLELTEGGDLIYDNAFYTTVTATSPPFNVYSGALDFWTDMWNITATPAATVNYAAGFPDFPLTGTIVGNATQGGNFWWDYGGANNPYGVLPYDEYSGGQYQIYDGGDFYPLVPTYYTVTLTEAGLTAGTAWSVTFAGNTTGSTATTIVYTVANGTYNWTAGGVSGYTVAPPSGQAAVTGTNLSILITYTAIVIPTYAVTFTESGLTAGTSWSVTINAASPSSTTTTIVVDLANGSYAWTAALAGGDLPTPSHGTANVAGGAVNIDIAYAPAPTYTVSFIESGLTSGTMWTVTFNGGPGSSTTPWINFTAANSSYAYSVGSVTGYNAPNPASGFVAVSGPTHQDITFTPTSGSTYAVAFTESGLTGSFTWTVTLNSVPQSSSGTTITFTEANGNYTYTVSAVTGYTASPSTGPITVNGAAPATTTITFTAVSHGPFTVTFTESGLPSGTNWSITLGSTTHASQTSTITFSEVNGNYSFTIGAVSGYSGSASSSSVTVNGAPAGVTVTFSGNSNSGTSGLTSIEWLAIGAVIAVIIIALLVALAMRGRGGSNASSKGPSDDASMDGDQSSGGGSN